MQPFVPDTNPLVITRVFHARQSVVYQALTDSEVMSRWFFAGEPGGCSDTGMRGCRVDAESVVGGEYRIMMIDADGNEHLHHGRFLELVPYHRIVFSWNSSLVTDTVVELALEEVETGTQLTLRHHGLQTPAHRDAHTHGWTACLNNLQDLYAQ